MKKFCFSLQKVLEIKEQILDNLKYELASLNHQVGGIETEIKNLNKKYIDINEEFNKKSSVCITVGEITYYKMLMGNILKKAETKKDEKEKLNKKIEDKKNEILNMNKEISSLEKLRENELEKYNAIITKSEEIFIEEFVSNKNMIKQYVF